MCCTSYTSLAYAQGVSYLPSHNFVSMTIPLDSCSLASNNHTMVFVSLKATIHRPWRQKEQERSK